MEERPHSDVKPKPRLPPPEIPHKDGSTSSNSKLPIPVRSNVPPRHLSSPGLSTSVDIQIFTESQLIKRPPRTILPPPPIRVDKEDASGIQTLLPPPVASNDDGLDTDYLYLCCEPPPITPAFPSTPVPATVVSVTTSSSEFMYMDMGTVLHNSPQRFMQEVSALDSQSALPVPQNTPVLFPIEHAQTEAKPSPSSPSSVPLPTATSGSSSRGAAEISRSFVLPGGPPRLQKPSDETQETSTMGQTTITPSSPLPSFTTVVAEQSRTTTRSPADSKSISFQSATLVATSAQHSYSNRLKSDNAVSREENTPQHQSLSSHILNTTKEISPTSTPGVVTITTPELASTRTITICMTTTLMS